MGEIYHYTKLDTLCGILRKDGLCFWGSRYDSMNDPTDATYAKNKLLPKLIELAKQQQKDYEYEDSYPYIVSFSKNQDDFNMWRLYNAKVAIVVDEEKLHNARIAADEKNNDSCPAILKDVRYASNEEISQVAFELYNEAKEENEFENYTVTDIFNIEVFPYIKNNVYEIEGEVRLVSPDFDGMQIEYSEESEDKCHIVDAEMPQNVKCRGTRNGLLLLYKEFLVPKEALCKIVVRTSDQNYFERLSKQLRVLLVANGYSADIPIERSKSAEFIETSK